MATAAPADRSVRLWSTSTGQELRKLSGGRPERVLFSPTGLLLITDVSGEAELWRVGDVTPVATLENTGRLTAAAFSPDGRYVVGGRGDGTVEMWDATTGASGLSLKGHDRRIVSVSFSPNGRRILTASEDATARVWNARTGEQQRLFAEHGAPLTDAQFDSTGSRVVTSGRDNDARVWSVAKGKLIHTLRAHFGAVVAASFSNDGRWIATAGPTTVGLWRARTGRFLGFVRGPSSTVTGASFSPKGHTIVASSVDGSVRVYQCEICGDLNQLVALGKRRVADAHGRRPT